ncbi:Ig-like domain-containing protein [Actinoplanes sp. NPDC049668]|uniref:Ig-like domain-containing protein n=1 Tax=unclassified Actinoplanes TaxID=2626549 RepID=UPI0033B59260
MLKAFRTAVIAALSSSLILATSAPGFADEAPADTAAPVIDSIGLTEGQVYSRATAPFVPVVSDDTGVVTLETLVDGARSRKFSVAKTGMRAAADLLSVPDGTEAEVTLRAYDAAGNVAEKSVRVIADVHAPTAKLVSPVAGTSMHSGPMQITLGEVSSDTIKIVMYDGRNGDVLATRTEGPWIFDWTAVGGGWVNFLATDAVGNRGYTSATYNVDDYPPAVSDLTYTRPAPEVPIPDIRATVTAKGATIAATGTLSASIVDPGLKRIEWRVDGVLHATDTQTITWDDRASTRSIATIEIRATDELDQTTTKTFPVTIDRAGPLVTSLTPAQNALVRGSYFVTDTKVKESSGIAFQELVGLPSIVNAPGGMAIFPKKDGPLKFTWHYVDKVGNESFTSRTVIVDRTKPSLKLTKAPANKAKVKGKVKVTASAADKNGIGRVELLINGKRVATDYRAGYAFSINTAKYGKTIKMRLRAYDRAGNYVYTSTRTWRR